MTIEQVDAEILILESKLSELRRQKDAIKMAAEEEYARRVLAKLRPDLVEALRSDTPPERGSPAYRSFVPRGWVHWGDSLVGVRWSSTANVYRKVAKEVTSHAP